MMKSLFVGAMMVCKLSCVEPTEPIAPPVIVPNEIVVSEQWLDEGNPIDVSPPTILSYWPDMSKGDGTVEFARMNCEHFGGELIAKYDPFLAGWVYKCEDIDY